MESEKGAVVTDAPPISTPVSQHSAARAPTSVEALVVEAAARATQSLKRQREATPTPTSPNSELTARLDPALSPAKSARLLNITARHSPAPLTGVAAVEDERRRQEEQYRLQTTGASENPAYRAQAALMSVESLAMSRPQDAPVEQQHHVEEHQALAPAIPDKPGSEHQTLGNPVDTPSAFPPEPQMERHPEQQQQQQLQPQQPAERQGGEQPTGHHVDPQLEAQPPQQEQQPGTEQADEVQHAAEKPTSEAVETTTATTATATTLPNSMGVDPKKAGMTEAMASLPSTTADAPVPITESPAPMDIDSRGDRSSFAAPPSTTGLAEKSGMSMSYPGLLPPEPMSASPARGMTMPVTPSHLSAPRSPNSKKHRCPYCETEFTRHHNLKSHLLTHSQEKPYVCQTCQMRFRRLHDLKRHSKLHTGEKPHICPKCDRKFARGDALARHSKGPGGCVGRRSSMGGSFMDDDMEGGSQLEGDSVMTDVVYDGANEGSISDEDRQRLTIQGLKPSQPHDSDKTAEVHTFSSGPSDSVLEALKSSISNLAATASAEAAQNGITENYSDQPSYGRDPAERHSSPGFSAADAARYAASAAAGATASVANAVPANGLPNQQELATNGQNVANGESSSNNMFSGDHGIWSYIHSLEDQLRQFNDRLQAMESMERNQEERISYLTDEVANLRHQIEARPALEAEKVG